jgi:large exoprotein involved in heme utilization and adhesion
MRAAPRCGGGRLTLSGGARISTSTVGSGRGGEVRVVATEAISLTGRGSIAPQTGLFSVTDGSGDAGRLFVSAPLLESAGGRILGRTLGGGHAGDIELRVGRLTLTEGAQIFNGIGNFVGGQVIGQADGLGRGGNLTVVATDSIFIAGHDQLGLPSGLFSSAQIGRGDAGNLFISTPTLTMMDSGLIAAETFSTSSGHAGNIDVQVGRLALSEGAQISSSSVGVGRGGNVTVAGTEQIELIKGGTIAASSSGQGEAGNIVIRAGQLFRSRNGAVTTEATRAGGGSIALHAGRLVQLQDSEVTTSVRGGGGDAGNLTLEAPFVVADGSAIVANAFGGRGGNILINAGVFLADPASLVSASSALGIQGTVDIQAPVTSLSGTLAPLPQAFVNVAALLPARCAARFSGGQASSLVLSGREGLPADPSGVLPSPLLLEARLAADPAVIGAPPQQPSAATFALLAGHEKALPRLGCPP